MDAKTPQKGHTFSYNLSNGILALVLAVKKNWAV